MAQPPAVVVRTFKPVGQLQLHHLGEHARFHCVHGVVGEEFRELVRRPVLGPCSTESAYHLDRTLHCLLLRLTIGWQTVLLHDRFRLQVKRRGTLAGPAGPTG